MTKMRKIFITTLSVMLLVALTVGLASCKKKPKENEKHYFLSFSVNVQQGDEPLIYDIECKIGDVITAPKFPNIAGIDFHEWCSSETNFSVGSEGQFTVTEEMFYEGAKNAGPDGNWDEYYGTFGLAWEYSRYTATVHGTDDFTDEFEFSFEDNGNVYNQASHMLLSSLTDFNYYEGGRLENVYQNGYAFDGWYLDEDYQTPLALTPNVTQSIDIYAKWTYVGLFFTYEQTYDREKEEYVSSYTLIKIDNSQPISVLNVPEKCNYLPVMGVRGFSILDGYLLQGSERITKLVLPESITYIPNNTFVSDCITEVVIGNNAIIAENAFNGATIKVTLSSSNSNYSVSNNVLYDLTNKNVHSVLATPSGDVVVPDGIVDFGLAFANSAITSIRIPVSVTQIESGAFENCNSLAWVIMHGDYDKGVNTIGQNAFKNCSALEYVVLSRDLETVGANAFLGCSSLEIIFYGGQHSGEWNYIQKQNSYLDGNVYYYSAKEQKLEDYAGDIKWHYDQNDTPKTWLTVKNNFAGKTFQVTSAVATVSDYYWDLIVLAKNNNLLEQIFPDKPEFYDAAISATSKAEFEEKLSTIYGNQLGKLEFGADGTVLISNELGSNVSFTYAELNDRIIIRPNGHNNYPKGTFYSNSEDSIFEIQSADKIGQNETITVKYFYTEVI